MGLVVHTAPTEEPISLAEAKNHLRAEIDITDDDSAITRMIKSARKFCELYRGETFVTTAWDLKLDRFPTACDRSIWFAGETILLPRPPLISIASISYVDTDGSTQSFINYSSDVASRPGRICPAYGYSWPSTRCQMNAVTIAFEAGYGAASTVPENIKDAILLLVAWRYKQREAVNIGNIVNEVPYAVKDLLNADRLIRVA